MSASKLTTRDRRVGLQQVADEVAADEAAAAGDEESRHGPESNVPGDRGDDRRLAELVTGHDSKSRSGTSSLTRTLIAEYTTPARLAPRGCRRGPAMTDHLLAATDALPNLNPM